jgi:hypothetical protein
MPCPVGQGQGDSIEDLRTRLRDLISALDRRVPYFDRDGEREIVRDAAVLRQQAADRLAKLE